MTDPWTAPPVRREPAPGGDAPAAGPGWGGPLPPEPEWGLPGVPVPAGLPPGWTAGPARRAPVDARRRASGLWLGLVSLGLELVSIVVAVIGIPLIFAFGAGFVLIALGILGGIAATCLALASLTMLVRSDRGPISTLVLRGVPAAGTLFLAGGIVVGLLAGNEAGGRTESGRRRLGTGFGAATVDDGSVADVVRVASGAFAVSRDADVCELLADRARSETCGRNALCEASRSCDGLPRADDVRVEREDGDRALVSYRFRVLAFDDRGVHRVRLERADGRWRLLDVPGIPDACVDTAADPFGCPVVRR